MSDFSLGIFCHHRHSFLLFLDIFSHSAVKCLGHSSEAHRSCCYTIKNYDTKACRVYGMMRRRKCEFLPAFHWLEFIPWPQGKGDWYTWIILSWFLKFCLIWVESISNAIWYTLKMEEHLTLLTQTFRH